MQVNTLVMVTGRLSARDEKEPQIVVDKLHPITDEGAARGSEWPGIMAQEQAAGPAQAQPAAPDRTLFVKISSADSPEYGRLKLVHMMFPGRERMVIHFEDTKKNAGAACVIHDAFIRELRDMLGEKNVIVK